jgi:hypothetical protein
MKSPDRRRTDTLPSAENGPTGLSFGVSCYRRPTIGASPTTFHTVSEGVFSEVVCLESEFLRSESLPESFPGRLEELGGAYDLFELGLGAVSPYVVFLEYLPKGHIVLHAGDDVVGDLLLTRGERGCSRATEEPLPERWPFAHEVLCVLPLAFLRCGLILPARKLDAYPQEAYSAECVEGGFCELRVDGVLGSSAS